ncbi:MAG: helix-turn-helix domain-containing protein [Christensenellales bacterium]
MEQFSDNADIPASFQTVFGNEAALFQVAELFPIPIQIFTPDGMTAFANRALLEMWNISDASQIVGRYNLIQDPVVNEELRLREYVQRVFRGEVVRVRDAKLPLKAFSEWYRPRRPDYAVKSMYLDILNFPIFDENRSMTHVVSVFIPTKVYTGQPGVAKAREYIETHWLEAFDMDKVAQSVHLEAFDMDKVAQSVHLSRYHLARLFKKQTGMTPYGYYQHVKIQKIREALRDTSITVAQAFASCGVAYSGNYARLFREKTGMTPTQYRKSFE